MKELTFREVIANIKEGEVYIRCYSRNRKIFMENGDIVIKNTDGFKWDCISETVHEKYELERQKVTFQEAFEAYEEGKEIESCVNNCKYIKEDGIDKFKDLCDEDWQVWFGGGGFDFDEIRGKWYIN